MKPNPTEKFIPEIRLLKIQEIDAVVELLSSQLREHGLRTDLDQVRRVIEQIVNNSQLGFVLVAVEKNGRPIGVVPGCAFLGIEHGGTSGCLEEFYMLPEFRERGVGSLLIAEFVKVASRLGWSAIDLEIDSSHPRAASLYERHGFQRIDRSRFSRTLESRVRTRASCL
jgi:GNAT superfamily N-acetyltransferase